MCFVFKSRGQAVGDMQIACGVSEKENICKHTVAGLCANDTCLPRYMTLCKGSAVSLMSAEAFISTVILSLKILSFF